MMKIDSSYYSCDICGRPIAAGEYIEVCSDCGAVFCICLLYTSDAADD